MQLTEAYHGSGRRVIADSWFGSVKCAKALMERGLYLIMLVKTAYKDFPRELLSQNNLQRSEWNTVTSETDDGELQACHSLDLQLKDFISSYKIQRQVQVIHKKQNIMV